MSDFESRLKVLEELHREEIKRGNLQMNIIMESGFWKDIQEKRLCPETTKCLLQSFANLEKLDTGLTKNEGNYIKIILFFIYK